MSGGVELAGTPERWHWLRSELPHSAPRARGRAAAHAGGGRRAGARSSTPAGLYGALFDPAGGQPGSDAVRRQAYAGLPREARCRDRPAQPGRGADAPGERRWSRRHRAGRRHREHVVNAAGLWARRVGPDGGRRPPASCRSPPLPGDRRDPGSRGDRRRHAGRHRPRGLHLPPAGGQRRAVGRLRDSTRPLVVEGAPWDFGCSPCSPRRSTGSRRSSRSAYRRFPVLEETGHPPLGHGAFTFTPDGNPLVGPVTAARLLGGLRRHRRLLAVRRRRPRARELDRGRRPRLRRVRDGCRAVRPLRLRGSLPTRHHRAVLRTPVRHRLPERGAAGRAAAQDRPPLRPAPRRRRPVHGHLGSGGAALLRRRRPTSRRTTPSAVRTPNRFVRRARSTRSAPRPAPTRSRSTRATRSAGPAPRPGSTACSPGRLPATGRIRLAPMLSASGRLMGDLSVTRLERRTGSG